jgi:uncharacterized membrane protein YbhN (UPF0104 family)
MQRTGARLLGAAAILVVLVFRLGTGPFVEGLRHVDATAIVAAVVLTAGTTVASAWRWRLVARDLGVDLPMGTAVASYYRSQLLNSTLPGGVVGDVHRAVSHGRDSGDLGRGVRAVVWERGLGQAVQLLLTLVVLLVLPSPVRDAAPVLALGVVVLAVTALVWWRRGARPLPLVLSSRHLPGVAVLSAVVVAGHATALVVATRVAGTDVDARRLVPLVLLVLAASSVPVSIGGWGPREGAAAWVFAAAGLGAAQGVATAVVYGVMVAVSTLPGLLVVLARAVRPYLAQTRVVRGVLVAEAGVGDG